MGYLVLKDVDENEENSMGGMKLFKCFPAYVIPSLSSLQVTLSPFVRLEIEL